MLADTTKSISSSFGCLIDEGDDAGIALRATYIIDPTGTLRHASLSDLPVGRNVDEVLRLVQAFQYSDEHGEVCPSGWKPGKATMVPDHESNKLAKFWEDEYAQKRQHVDDVNKQTDSAVNMQSTPQTEQAIESNEIQSDMEGQESDNSEAASITSKDKKAKHRQDKRREKKIKRKKKD